MYSAYLEDRREVYINTCMYRRLEKGVEGDNRNIHTWQHDALLFMVAFPNYETFKRSVQYTGATAWNNLPVNFRAINPYDAFKAHQKKKKLMF